MSLRWHSLTHSSIRGKAHEPTLESFEWSHRSIRETCVGDGLIFSCMYPRKKSFAICYRRTSLCDLWKHSHFHVKEPHRLDSTHKNSSRAPLLLLPMETEAFWNSSSCTQFFLLPSVVGNNDRAERREEEGKMFSNGFSHTATRRIFRASNMPIYGNKMSNKRKRAGMKRARSRKPKLNNFFSPLRQTEHDDSGSLPF